MHDGKVEDVLPVLARIRILRQIYKGISLFVAVEVSGDLSLGGSAFDAGRSCSLGESVFNMLMSGRFTAKCAVHLMVPRCVRGGVAVASAGLVRSVHAKGLKALRHRRAEHIGDPHCPHIFAERIQHAVGRSQELVRRVPELVVLLEVMRMVERAIVTKGFEFPLRHVIHTSFPWIREFGEVLAKGELRCTIKHDANNTP